MGPYQRPAVGARDFVAASKDRALPSSVSSRYVPLMTRAKRVIVAMSGGVDSSVAALLLTQAGYDVIGLSLRLYRCPSEGTHGCCTAADRRDARAVCERLGIPHHVVDATEAFHQDVIAPFVAAYLSGRTPSPCIACNEHVKFPWLLGQALALGAEHIATGHYARVERDPAGTPCLLRAADAAKDQSYFLFSIGRDVLERLVLPVGGLRKSEVRRIAREHGLPVSDKPESQEVCFVPPEGYVAFIESQAPDRLPGPGRFLDSEGRDVGSHSGCHGFTVGQRKGLGLGGGPRRYVTRIVPERNEVVLGDAAALTRSGFTASDVHLLDDALARDLDAGSNRRVRVQIRSRHRAAPARISLVSPGRLLVALDEPQSAVAPGQAAVFYDGLRVLGGGFIEREA